MLADAMTVEPSPNLTTLMSEVRNILGIDRLDQDTPLIDLGVDSISIVEIMLTCEAIYKTSMVSNDVAIDQYTTLKDIDDQITALAS